MVNSFINKIGGNEFRIDFETDVSYRKSKTIKVDGEIYTKEWCETVKFDSKEDFINAKKTEPDLFEHHHYDMAVGYWRRLVIHEFFAINGQIYYVWNYTGFMTNPAEMLVCYNRSSNAYVNILKSLVDNGFVKKCISSSSGRKEYTNETLLREHILSDRSVWIDIMEYGSGYYMSVKISIYNILKTNFTSISNTIYFREIRKLSNKLPKMFPQIMLYKKLTDIERNKIAINILNLSINFKEKTL